MVVLTGFTQEVQGLSEAFKDNRVTLMFGQERPEKAACLSTLKVCPNYFLDPVFLIEFDVFQNESVSKNSIIFFLLGPGKAEVDIQDRKDGSCHVSYIVDEPGEYSIGVRFNDTLIPDSPSKVI